MTHWFPGLIVEGFSNKNYSEKNQFNGVNKNTVAELFCGLVSQSYHKTTENEPTLTFSSVLHCQLGDDYDVTNDHENDRNEELNNHRIEQVDLGSGLGKGPECDTLGEIRDLHCPFRGPV